MDADMDVNVNVEVDAKVDKQSFVNADDCNFLKMMQHSEKNYNKIRKNNKQQLSSNAKNPRQSEVTEKIHILYDEVDAEFKNFKSNLSSPCFKHKMIRLEKSNPVLQSSLFKSIYVPSKIAEYIKENARYVIEYSCDLGNGKSVKVKFILFDSNRYELNNIRKKGATYFKQSVLKIYTWLKVLSKYSDVECGKNLECFFYFTPFKRNLPSHSDSDTPSNMYHYSDSVEDDVYEAGKGSGVIGASHVNGGLSNVCQPDGHIIVYRKEEWFKVFIHETMHNYGLDFSVLDDILVSNKKLQSIFSIQTDIKIFESYCETWARVMNVFFESYFEVNRHSLSLFTPLCTRKKTIHNIHNIHKNHKHHVVSVKNKTGFKDKKERFLTIFYDNMQHEAVFSIFQCVKILNYMGLDYNIISNCNDTNYIVVKKLYKENTNVFAYYVIVSILIGNFNNFILWCIDNNTNLFQFKKKPSSVDDFIAFISKNYKNNDLLKMIVSMEKRLETRTHNDELLLNTMRMSVVGGK
jgi:hypothetical protein